MRIYVDAAAVAASNKRRDNCVAQTKSSLTEGVGATSRRRALSSFFFTNAIDVIEHNRPFLFFTKGVIK